MRGMGGAAHVFHQLLEVVLDPSHAGRVVLRLVLVVVAAEDVEVLAREIDQLLAPVHVVRALLSARDDLRLRCDRSQPRAVQVDDGGVGVGRKPVVHRLVVDLDIGHAIRLRVAVCGAPLAPLGGRRIDQVVHPLERVLELCRVRAGRGQDDHRRGPELPAELQELVRAEAVVVGVSAPDRVRVVLAGDRGTDAVLPLVDRGVRTAWPADERRRQSLERGQQIRAQLAAVACAGPHERNEIHEHGARPRRDELERRLPIGGRARELEVDLLPSRTVGLQRPLRELTSGRAQDAQAHGQRAPLGIEP